MKEFKTRMNIDKTCRVCLGEEKNLKSLFSVEQVLENEIQLSDILMSCSSIRVAIRKIFSFYTILLTRPYIFRLKRMKVYRRKYVLDVQNKRILRICLGNYVKAQILP